MDTSPEYIKMCEKAVEVQTPEMHDHSSNGNFYAFNTSPPTWWVICDSCLPWSEKAVWLPRQDQLQAMVQFDLEQQDLRYNGNYRLASRFADFIACDNGALDSIDTRKSSMEQLWLVYVMAWCYQKRWTGSDWEAE